MSDSLDLDTLRRITRAHLESIRAAGIDWLPSAPPLERRRSEPPVVGKASAARQASAPPAAATPTTATSPEPARPSVSGREALTLLTEEVAGCMRCPALASTRTQTVFGQGAVQPELCFLGEAPGA